MTQGVQDLIKAINSGDSSEIDSAFNAEMANRISTRLEDMRVSVAQGMFATEQSVEETVEEELTLEDYSVEEVQEFMQTEDFEQLDELSKKTLANYITRAAGNTGKGHKWPHDNNLNYSAQSYGVDKADEDEPGDSDSDNYRRMDNRLTGIDRAAKKLAKNKK